MREIEELFSDARRFELFTGRKSERNLHLYRKLGYTVRDADRSAAGVPLIYLDKEIGRPGE